jgi:hypothetical protein
VEDAGAPVALDEFGGGRRGHVLEEGIARKREKERRKWYSGHIIFSSNENVKVFYDLHYICSNIISKYLKV